MHTEWEDTVCSLAQHLSQELGLLSTASVEAVLQQVTLCDIPDNFNLSSEEDTPPYAFATMVVLLLPPHAVCVCCNGRLKSRRLGTRRFMSLACGLNSEQTFSSCANLEMLAESASYSASGQPSDGCQQSPALQYHIGIVSAGLHCLFQRYSILVALPSIWQNSFACVPASMLCIALAAYAWTACKARRLSALAF